MNLSSEAIFTDELLRAMRFETDPMADAVIHDLFETGKTAMVNQLLAGLSKNNYVLPCDLPKTASEYFTETAHLPLWADPKRMAAGAAFFAKHVRPILSVLGCLSLPYCYAAAHGAQVLYLSQRLQKNTRKRLAETAQFVLQVMDKCAFDHRGTGIRVIQKVRLMHAAVRYHSLKSGRWNEEWGQPINQEDMAGTNLAFSYIVLEGLNKLGFYYEKDEAEDFLHLWNVIGYLLGVRPVLLPANLKGAFWLDKRICERHFRASEAGVELAKSLIQCFDELNTSGNGALDGFTPAYMRFLLGDKVADILSLPHSGWTKIFIAPIKMTNAFTSVVNSFKHKEASAYASNAILLAIQQENGNAHFSIPTILKNAK